MKDCAVVKCRTAETREFSGRFPFRQHYPGVFWFPWGKQGRWGSHASLMTSTVANPNPNPNPNPKPLNLNLNLKQR